MDELGQIEVRLDAMWSFSCYTLLARMLGKVRFMISSRSYPIIREIMFHVCKLISKEEYPDLRKILGVGLLVNFGCISSLQHHHFNSFYLYI